MSITSFTDPNIAKNLANEILTLIGNDIKTADTSLYERKSLEFRDIVDNNFPTMLVIDYTSIKQELKQYQDIDTALKTYIEESYKPTAKDYSANKFSDKEVDLLLKAIKLGIQSFSKTTTSISYKLLQAQLSNILDLDKSSYSTLSEVKRLFSKIYKLSDISNNNIEVFIFPNFANLGNLLRRHLSIGLDAAQTSADTFLEIDSIGQILAYGHTAAGYIDDKGTPILNFNSPKCLAVIFDVINSGSDKSPVTQKAALDAASFFVNDTRQIETYITIEKDFTEGFVKAFVSIGGNIVKFENSIVNSRRGSILEKREKRGVNKQILKKLSSLFASADTIISKRLARYVLTNTQSPSIQEYISHNIVTSLTGKATETYRGKGNTSLIDKSIIKKEVIAGIAKSKIKLPVLTKLKTNPPKRTFSLINLQNLINQHLQSVISANMGDGSSRNILNYRTGRFAASAAVERMSQSRAGMITAFYTYMKNPYQTFEPGYRQGSPKSRDPKLLISKSIREIAAEKVGNRLRAVLV